jgi:glutamate N-acetyltransferase/amino-acid N-acetyltransferase
MVSAMPDVTKSLQSSSVLPAAEGIMTTDRYAKVASADMPNGARIVGIAKGAGMIEPNMATMLCYILTDADIKCDRAELQACLAEAVNSSFNSISIDGDESTSDTVALLSSCRGPETELTAFNTALTKLCRDLASQVVRNGEGTQHVIRVSVIGATDDATAKRIAKSVVNGPLFKSAVAGNDPNVGRLVAKVGQGLSASGAHMASGCICRIGGEVIFDSGRFTLDTEKERRLSAHLQSAHQDDHLKYPSHQRVVDVEVCLGGGGSGNAVVLGSDLTAEYVAINADYRS